MLVTGGRARGAPSVLAAGLAVLIAAQSAAAAGLSPLRKEGLTASRTKGFYVSVLNPYSNAMPYELKLFEPDMRTRARNAAVFPRKLRIGAKRGRKVILKIDIPDGKWERTIVMCAASPENASASVSVRVCGTYVARGVR